MPALAALVAALWLPGAAAVKVDGLYEGQVAVASEDETERAAALGKALRQVISKLTGVSRPAGAAVEAAVADPLPFLQQYQYREAAQAPGSPVLWARFDRAAVDDMLRGSDLPRWSEHRPAVLAWVVVVGSGGEDLLGSDDPSGAAAALAGRAWERGVPLSFPLLDLEDRVRVRPGELWTLDEATLRDLSARYGPGALLVGRLEQAADGWAGSWRLLDAGSESQWATRGADGAGAAADAVDAVADRLAARYALAGPAAAVGSLEIRVTGVRTLDDYARTFAYLQGLDQISGLVLSGARGDELAFRMAVRGGAEALGRVTSFGGVLAADSSPARDGSVRYRLLP